MSFEGCAGVYQVHRRRARVGSSTRETRPPWVGLYAAQALCCSLVTGQMRTLLEGPLGTDRSALEAWVARESFLEEAGCTWLNCVSVWEAGEAEDLRLQLGILGFAGDPGVWTTLICSGGTWAAVSSDSPSLHWASFSRPPVLSSPRPPGPCLKSKAGVDRRVRGGGKGSRTRK